MTTTLITGANKGLGKETARRLLAAGHTVYVAARDEDRGRKAAADLGARFVQLDVTDQASVDAAAKQVEFDGGLDVLINNAGVEGRQPDNAVPGAAETTAEAMLEIFDTNVFGLVRVSHAFLPLLQRSSDPAIVNVSSGLGSLAMLSDPASYTHFYPGIAYPVSKAVVNAVTIQFAKAFPGHPRQCGGPRLHGYRSERPYRHADGGRGRRNHRGHGPGWTAGTVRHVHLEGGSGGLVRV